MPVIQNEEDYSNFDKYIQEIWNQYPQMSKACRGFVALPQTKTKDDPDPTPYIEPFNHSIVNYTSWASSEPTSNYIDQGFYGLVVNVDRKDRLDEGYYCQPPHKSKHCFVCESSTPLPTLYSIRGLCANSQFNQKYVLLRNREGTHYYQGDSHANISYQANTWTINSMVNKWSQRQLHPHHY